MARDQVTTGPTLSRPEWTNDVLGRDQLLPGGAHLDGSQFPRLDAVRVTLGANAAANATSLTVTALPGPIPAGSFLDFGTTKLAITTAAVAAGVTAIPVRALPTAMTSGDVGTYLGVGNYTVLSGTAVGRTYTERDAATGFGTLTYTDDEIYIVANTITNASGNTAVTLVRPYAGVTLKEDFLPNWATMTSNEKAALRARFITVRGEV